MYYVFYSTSHKGYITNLECDFENHEVYKVEYGERPQAVVIGNRFLASLLQSWIEGLQTENFDKQTV